MHPIMHRTDEHLETASCMAQLYYTIFYLAFFISRPILRFVTVFHYC